MTSRSFKRVRLISPLGLCLFLALTCLTPRAAYAQQLYGAITGNVTDPTGAALPGAEVKISHEGTNYTQATVSNDVGVYTLLNVPRGEYTLKVTLPGFKEYVAQNLVVMVGNVTRENVTLQLGEIADQITVSAASTVLQTDTTDVRAKLETKEISNLPVGQYRNYQSLINLVPGATPARFQNSIMDPPTRALTTNINGTARNMNSTRIDGAMSVNVWLPHHTAMVPPSETIEEVNISTNNFDAEQGLAGGAAITVITKSGTNEFHGSAFAYHDNSSLTARNFFNFVDTDGDGKADNPPGRRHIVGGTLGGPIIKNTLFFFGSWEGVFQGRSISTISTLPTEDQRRGDFSRFLPVAQGGTCTSGCTVIYDPLTGNPNGSGRTPFRNNVIPQNRLSAAALRMQSLLPPTNQPGLTQNHNFAGREVLNRNDVDFKTDWYRSDEHRIWGKFSLLDARVIRDPRFGPGGGFPATSGIGGKGDTDTKVYSAGHNWTLSTAVQVDGNFSFTDRDQAIVGPDIEQGNFGQEVLGIPGTNAAAGQEKACIVNGFNRCGGLPRFNVTGFTVFGQPSSPSPLFRDEKSVTFTHNFSWVRGKHELRWGYDVVRHMMDHWQPEIGSGARGSFNFNREVTGLRGGPATRDQNAWAAFLLGLPSSVGKSLQWELMTANEWQHAWYLRDRWQVTRKLTFTLGLRYEFYPLVTRDDRKMEFLDLNSFELVLDNNVQVSKKLFAPRIGLAYRLTDNDVIRSGYGITYSPMPFSRPLRGFFPLTIASDFESANPFTPVRTLSEGIPLFTGPETRPGARIPLPPFVQQRTMPADKITRGYIQSWNLVYERKLPSEFVVSFGYVGTQTTHQLGDRNINWSPPGGGTQGRRLFPRSTTEVLFWDGWLSMNYHSLQVAVNRRFTRGLFVKGAYTYSQAINMADDEGWDGVGWNDPALIGRNRAQAGFNVPHIFQLGMVYELPFGKGDGLASQVVGGWQVNAIVSAHSNRPFTVGSASVMNARGNIQTADQVKPEVKKLGGIGVGTPYFDPTAFAPVTRTPGTNCTNLDCYGTSGRNILRGPDWRNLDLSIFRTFMITEGVGLEFRSEFFNITNTPHFSNPVSNASSRDFMLVTSTDENAPERTIRFAFRLKW